MDLLRVENVYKSYVSHTALCDVSLSVPTGSIYGLLGPNGAGKTTLIRIINRITAPDSGKIYFDGRELMPEDITSIGYLPEERGLYKKMRVGEQAVYFGRLKGLTAREATARLKKWFIEFGIEQWWNRRVEELSKGMAQKVQFIVTVLHEPKLLILDEPFSGFDPINANLIKQKILHLREQGATVIFSTHNMSSVEEICDHITLINKSRNILSGETSAVRRKYGINAHEIDFTGDADLLCSRISGLGDATLLTPGGNGIQRVMVNLTGEDKLPELINITNSTVSIKSLNEVIPSMNDIFIKAVGGELDSGNEK